METKYFGLRKWFSIFSVLIVTMMNSQTTFRITDIPSDNTKGLRIFMASNINDWKPNDERFEFKKNADAFYTLTIPAYTGKIEYKITQGSWDIAETDENGNSIQNRVLENSDKSQIVELKISKRELYNPTT